MPIYEQTKNNYNEKPACINNYLPVNMWCHTSAPAHQLDWCDLQHIYPSLDDFLRYDN